MSLCGQEFIKDVYRIRNENKSEITQYSCTNTCHVVSSRLLSALCTMYMMSEHVARQSNVAALLGDVKQLNCTRTYLLRIVIVTWSHLARWREESHGVTVFS